MKNCILLLTTLLLLNITLVAQYQKTAMPLNMAKTNSFVKSPEFKTPIFRELSPSSLDLSWRPMLTNICVKHHSENSDELIERIKEQKLLLKKSAFNKTDNVENSTETATYTPVIAANFLGNVNNGYTPMDNSIAISNAGKIVSVANTTIEFYNTSGTMTFTNTIDGFFNDPSITVVCDPVVIYDSGSDRFIFFAQECSGNSSNSNLLVCFSKTNDPNSGWWTYKLTGNPAGNNTWFDYPKIAVSNNELYITGNSFNNSGSYVESLIYQIEKNGGYSGGTLNWQYWNNITGNPFTLLPVSNGQQGNYGPGCYLVATSSAGNNSFSLFDLTNDMSSSSETINQYTISTTPYSPAADGEQLGTPTVLDNGDCRTLSGFYLNGTIHFVFHSEYSGGYNGVNYNRLDLSTGANTSSMFGTNSAESSYPSIASFGSDLNDKSVMIGFGRTNSSMYPEIRVVSCDHAMRWGSSTLVKAGQGYADIFGSGTSDRWGDYTGMCRKQNSTTPTVWMNGMYGTTANNWNTWIAEVGATGSSGVSTQDIPNIEKSSVYPTLVYDQFFTEFSLENNTNLTIEVYNTDGKLVKELFNGPGHFGKNVFTFNKNNLSSGTYFVSIKSTNKVLLNEKIIINN